MAIEDRDRFVQMWDSAQVKKAGKSGRKPKAALLHRGVLIRKPAAAPSIPLAKIRRAARIAVQRLAHDLTVAE